MSNIKNWLSGFLSANGRNLEQPDGRPLYAYQLQEIEFNFLESILSTSIIFKAEKYEWINGIFTLLLL